MQEARLVFRILGAVVVFLGPLLVLGVGLKALDRLPGYRELKGKIGKSMPGVRRGLGHRELEKVLRRMQALRLQSGQDGLSAFRAFLVADVAFPLFYGAGMIAAVSLGLRLSGLAASSLWYLAPVLAAVADWSENSVLLRQRARFEKGQALERGLVGLGNLATRVKVVALLASLLVCGLLAVRSV